MFNHPIHYEPTLASIAPLFFSALAGSHAFTAARWAVDAVVERVFWRGSDEDIKSESLKADMIPTASQRSEEKDEEREDFGFWDGASQGVALIRENVKTE